VLVACSDAKVETKEAVPLLELYNGPLWQDLRANGKAIPDRNKFVLSGKWGFLSVAANHKPYDEKISKQKVDKLIERGIHEGERGKPGTMPGPDVYGQVRRDKFADAEYQEHPYTQVIIHGAGDYQRGFNAIVTQLQQAGVIAPDAPVVATSGTILARRKQFNEFLRAATGKEEKAPDVSKSLLARGMSGENVSAEVQAAPPVTAPEHIRAVPGKAVDPTNVYPKPDGPTRIFGDLAPDVMELPLPHDAFREITQEWNELFAAPQKGERKNLEVTMKNAPTMPVAEAQAVVDGWKAEAKRQYDDPRIREENSKKTILSLFDFTGEWSKPYEEAG
jgi:hypothetical protein